MNKEPEWEINRAWYYCARPPKPKMKQVKLFAYLGISTLQYMREDSLQQSDGWIRQPHLDLIAEVPE